jgi:hypothetical protein
MMSSILRASKVANAARWGNDLGQLAWINQPSLREGECAKTQMIIART